MPSSNYHYVHFFSRMMRISLCYVLFEYSTWIYTQSYPMRFSIWPLLHVFTFASFYLVLPGLVAMSRVTLYGLSLIAGNGISVIHSSLDFIMLISKTTWSVTQKNQLCGTRDFFRSKGKVWCFGVMYKCVVLKMYDIHLYLTHKTYIFYKMILCIIPKCSMPFYKTALSIILSFWFLPPWHHCLKKEKSEWCVLTWPPFIFITLFSFVNVISCVFHLVVFIVV